MKTSQVVSKYETIKNHHPLMVGVHVRLKKKHPELTDSAISRFLKRHTGSKEYLQNLVKKGKVRRYTLSGKAVGTVTHWEKAQAHQRLAELKEKPARSTLSLRKVS